MTSLYMGKLTHRLLGLDLSKQTDKAFALNGKRTHPYMSCSELVRPRIKKNRN